MIRTRRQRCQSCSTPRSRIISIAPYMRLKSPSICASSAATRHCNPICSPSGPHAWSVAPTWSDFLSILKVVWPAATGGSAMKAVEVLHEHGVPEERIIFINLVRDPVLRFIKGGLQWCHASDFRTWRVACILFEISAAQSGGYHFVLWSVNALYWIAF